MNTILYNHYNYPINILLRTIFSSMETNYSTSEEISSDKCYICLEPNGDIFNPCCHNIHKNCLKNYLKMNNKNNCPICSAIYPNKIFKSDNMIIGDDSNKNNLKYCVLFICLLFILFDIWLIIGDLKGGIKCSEKDVHKNGEFIVKYVLKYVLTGAFYIGFMMIIGFIVLYIASLYMAYNDGLLDLENNLLYFLVGHILTPLFLILSRLAGLSVLYFVHCNTLHFMTWYNLPVGFGIIGFFVCMLAWLKPNLLL